MRSRGAHAVEASDARYSRRHFFEQNQSSSSGMKNERTTRIGLPSRRIAAAAARARAAAAAGAPADVLGTYASSRNVGPIVIVDRPAPPGARDQLYAPQNDSSGTNFSRSW